MTATKLQVNIFLYHQVFLIIFLIVQLNCDYIAYIYLWVALKLHIVNIVICSSFFFLWVQRFHFNAFDPMSILLIVYLLKWKFNFYEVCVCFEANLNYSNQGCRFDLYFSERREIIEFKNVICFEQPMLIKFIFEATIRKIKNGDNF